MKRLLFCLLILFLLIGCTDFELVDGALDETEIIFERLEKVTNQLNDLLVEINGQFRTGEINNALKNVDRYSVLGAEYDKLIKEYELATQNYKNLVTDSGDSTFLENVKVLDSNLKTLKSNKKDFKKNIKNWEELVQGIEVIEDNGDFKVIYEQVTSPTFFKFEKYFRDSQIFEAPIEGLNKGLSLPKDIGIVLKECGESNAFYDSTTSQIYLCYELFTHIIDVFQDTVELEEESNEASLLSVTYFVLFHEMGHALVDVLNLPITGKEEDAMDQLSTMFLIEGGYSDQVLEGANWFYLNSQNEQQDGLAFWDEHSLDSQRYYNLLCWTYGKNPQEFDYLITEWKLPKERAEKCSYEYAQLYGSWNYHLAPYIKANMSFYLIETETLEKRKLEEPESINEDYTEEYSGDPACELLGCSIGAQLVGSENSDIYHECGSSYALRINPENLLCFSDEEAAIAYGYKASKR